jgi:DNA helicase II / ATP-dependent DNA helicase PcrA
VFLFRAQHVDAYVAAFKPQSLRHSVSSAKTLQLTFMNFRVAKGAKFQRPLIAPTSNVAEFVRCGTCIEPLAASSFYVAVTRAEQSVAIVLDDPGASMLPYSTRPAQQRL